VSVDDEADEDALHLTGEQANAVVRDAAAGQEPSSPAVAKVARFSPAVGIRIRRSERSRSTPREYAPAVYWCVRVVKTAVAPTFPWKVTVKRTYFQTVYAPKSLVPMPDADGRALLGSHLRARHVQLDVRDRPFG
jgi:hypothetical protein